MNLKLKMVNLNPPSQRLLCAELMLKAGYTGTARGLANEAEELRTYLVSGTPQT